MKLKYDCQVYNSRGEEFSLIQKGTEIRVLRVDKRSVKIEWDKTGDPIYNTRYGFISHRQFIICVEDDSKKGFFKKF